MDLGKAIADFVLVTIPAVLLYFIGWIFLSSHLEYFAINISELELDVPTVFIYSFSPFWTIVNRLWLYLLVLLIGIIGLVWLVKTFLPTLLSSVTKIVRFLQKTVLRMLATQYGKIGFAVLVLLAFLVGVVPIINWAARLSAEALWNGEGARIEPILTGDNNSLWHQDYKKCAARGGLEFIFSDKNSIYVLCRSKLTPSTGTVFEVRREAGLMSVRSPPAMKRQPQ